MKKYFGVELLLVKSTDFVSSSKPPHFSFGETEVSTGDSKESKSFEILVAYIFEQWKQIISEAPRWQFGDSLARGYQTSNVGFEVVVAFFSGLAFRIM